MTYAHVLAPGQIGSLEIRNRVSLSPMEKNWCDRLGNPGQMYVDYYALRARNGVGSMNFEATYIDPRGRGNLRQLGLWSDDNIPAHRRLTEAVRRYGCKTAAELNHGGRNCNTERTLLQPVGPSNVPFPMVGGHELHALSKSEIADIQRAYRDGARRAAEAGYDMITIHGAHGYLVSNFLSLVVNQRDDEYGGSDENRWRFLVEIYQTMRAEVGRSMPIGLRLSVEEEVESGYQIDYAIRLVKKLEAMGLDYIDVSTGLYESIETLIQPMDMRPGVLLPLAHRIKQAVGIPVIGAGRINDMDLAERAVAEGECDYVHMGRAFHADPEILSKSVGGRKSEVVGCIACNKCCMELFVNRPSVCTVNPAVGREAVSAPRPAARKKRVLVAGGGMAGMEAAAVAAARGHDVTLFERSDRLGGFVNVLGAPPTRKAWLRAIQDRARMMQAAGVTLHMGAEVTADTIRALRPDVVIDATGTRPFLPRYVPGWDSPMVTDYEAIAAGRAKPGREVVVIGGQTIGMGVAEQLADSGAAVTVIEASGAIAQDLEFMAQKMLQARLASSKQIRVRLKTNVEAIGSDRVTVQSGGNREVIEGVDQVVFALERMENRALADAALGGLVEELGIDYRLVGDVDFPGDTHAALLSGHRAAQAI